MAVERKDRLLMAIAPSAAAWARAFTLVEVMITVTIIALMAALVVPLMGDDNRVRLIAATSVLRSDIELAQVMTMAYPQDPVVVRFDADKQTYWLAFQSDTETPISRVDNGEPYVVQFGAGRAMTADGVQIELSQVLNDTLTFNAQGGIVDFTDSPMIELSRGGSALTLAVAPTTGTITELEGDLESQGK
jgi:prepilin-type N-terminal cleavage/methylation domain-containing protein